MRATAADPEAWTVTLRVHLAALHKDRPPPAEWHDGAALTARHAAHHPPE